MSKINEGGFAFPTPTLFSPTGQFLGGGSDGMTLRDWFAGQAIGGMLASQYVCEHAGVHNTDAGMVEGLALRSYQIADAMIAAREVIS